MGEVNILCPAFLAISLMTDSSLKAKRLVGNLDKGHVAVGGEQGDADVQVGGVVGLWLLRCRPRGLLEHKQCKVD